MESYEITEKTVNEIIKCKNIDEVMACVVVAKSFILYDYSLTTDEQTLLLDIILETVRQTLKRIEKKGGDK